MPSRAVFISRTSAYLALKEQGKRKGMPDEEINLTGRVYPVYVRGAMQGFEAWLDHSPILEN